MQRAERAHLLRKWSPRTGLQPQCQGRACSSMPRFLTCSEQPTWSYLQILSTNSSQVQPHRSLLYGTHVLEPC